MFACARVRHLHNIRNYIRLSKRYSECIYINIITICMRYVLVLLVSFLTELGFKGGERGGRRVRGTSQSTRASPKPKRKAGQSTRTSIKNNMRQFSIPAWQRKGAHVTLETEQIMETKRACALHVRQSSATSRVLQKEDGREGHWAQEDLPSGTWSCG